MLVWHLAQEKVKQVVLSRLSKDHSVDGQRPPKRSNAIGLTREGQEWCMALKARVALGEHPVRHESASISKLLIGELVGHVPHASTLTIRGRRLSPVADVRPDRLGNVLPNGVAVIAVNTAFPLFKVNRVRREVPVDHRMAIPMKIETFLSDGGRTQHEWPERRIERGPNGIEVFTRLPVGIAATVVRVATSEVLTHRIRHPIDSGGLVLPLNDVKASSSQLKSSAECLDQIGGFRLATARFSGDVKVFVKHAGEPALERIGKHAAPMLTVPDGHLGLVDIS